MKGTEAMQAPAAERGVLLAAAISGIFYFILALARPPDGPPVETATAAEIRAFLSENGTALRLGALVGALAIPTVIVFTVCLARLVRRRLPDSVLADLISGGGVLVAVLHWLVASTAGMVAALTDLKARTEGELSIVGSPTLIRGLLDEGLVDRLALMVYPLVIDGGVRLLDGVGSRTELTLLDCAQLPKSVVHLTYGRAGSPAVAATGAKR